MSAGAQPHLTQDPTLAAAKAAERYLGGLAEEQRRRWGQYSTPSEVAHFMAQQVGEVAAKTPRILDLGAGSGTLGLAVAAALLGVGRARVELVSVEAERGIFDLLRASHEQARGLWGDRLGLSALLRDALGLATPDLFHSPLGDFDVVISNPPYFKLSPREPLGGDAPNIYARFMEVGARLLKPGGKMCVIVPRSFASGLYFKPFRKRLHQLVALQKVHVFQSRREAFGQQGVLQENVIVTYQKTSSVPRVWISSSEGVGDLGRAQGHWADAEQLLDPNDDNAPLCIPGAPEELGLMARFERWGHRLADHGLEVSTGPVVAFRAEEHLRREAHPEAAPLLWLQHVQRGRARWPLGESFHKSEYISMAAHKLLVPNQTCILLRRFSAKEEARRIIAAPLLQGQIPGAQLGLENHLNRIYRPRGAMSPEEAWGLAAFLNSRGVDRFFRVSSGNTQVSATELRALPLPPLEALRALGHAALASPHADPDQLTEDLFHGDD
jgi:adenine-specific DNA-methyltransferase